MTLIHTSPVKIEKIKKEYGSGVFEDVLFFSTDVYCMTSSNTVYEYHVEVEENEIIRARELEDYYDTDTFKEAQINLADSFDSIIDFDDAYDLIANYKEAYDYESTDYEELAKLSWTVQKVQAQLASKFGFRFVESRDEQGTVYAGAMTGRESELVLFEE
jgi:hypothetical protein